MSSAHPPIYTLHISIEDDNLYDALKKDSEYELTIFRKINGHYHSKPLIRTSEFFSESAFRWSDAFKVCGEAALPVSEMISQLPYVKFPTRPDKDV